MKQGRAIVGRARVADNVATLSLALIVLLLPFNDVPWYGRRLGELSGERWIAPGMLLVTLWLASGCVSGSLVWPRTHSAVWLRAWLFRQ